MDLEILQIASDTKNQKPIKNYTHNLRLKNSLCGDELQIELIIKNNKIVDFGYHGKSCIFCQASASLLSRISVNNQKDKINNCMTKLTAQGFVEENYLSESSVPPTGFSPGR